MTSIVITTVQIPVSDYVEKNVETLTKTINDHKFSDWILTPEASLSGYCQPPNLQTKTPQQVERLHKSLHAVEQVQKASGTGLILGTGMIEQDGMPYNQQRIYNPQGDLDSVYNKRMLTRAGSAGEILSYLPGYTPCVFPLTDDSSIRAGALICNDAWANPGVSPEGNPYYINEYARLGAEIVFVSAMCNVQTFDQMTFDWHDIHLRTLARTNNIFVVVSNTSFAMGWGPHDVYDPNTEHEKKTVDRVQVPSGIISPEGEWIAQCKPSGTDSATMEIVF